MAETSAWQVGQNAVIDRRQVVQIVRVTPSGRAVVAGMTFEADGRERGNGRRRKTLEPLTDEIVAEMALEERGKAAANAAYRQLSDAERWVRRVFNSWGSRALDPADVDRAEKLTAAIRQVMEMPE